MCGISGIFSTDEAIIFDLREAVERMMDAQIHRGPDSADIYISIDNRMGLGHRRLSIIDLSSYANQPLCNESKTIWIVYNGEIYNFKELREELKIKGHHFKSKSDTEVIIHLYEEKDEKLLKDLRGMFAFAIWDEENKKIFIARDRFGIKPLYYSYSDGIFIFSSEIKAIVATNLINRTIDSEALGLYLYYGFIPSPKTIYKNISALSPGHFLIIDKNGFLEKCYYELTEAILDTSLLSYSEEEAIEKVRFCLLDTVKRHLISDVPIGAFLSGGIDSTSIVALMREVEHKSIKTVSVIFPDTAYDESRYSKIVAKKFNTDHVEVEISGKHLIEHLDKIFYAMDQPTIDGINTYFVSWATAQAGLKVAMSGLGGDEIFWGYPSFIDIPRLYRLLKILSFIPLRRKLASIFLKNYNSSRRAKLYSMLSIDLSIPEIYINYRGLFTKAQVQRVLAPDFAEEVMNGIKPVSYLAECSKISDKLNQISLLETTTYMINQLLRDTDVFSMTHSLEVRVPFIDHELVELLAKLPVKYKIKKDMPKRLLIKALSNKLPNEVVHRPKMGFTFPFDLWIRNELRGLIEEDLNNSKIFNKHFIKILLNAYYNNKIHWSRLWGCFVLTKWVN